MKILHIVGNGFDLNLGLETSYPNFYKYYQNIPTKSESIKNLKKNISGNYQNWSDLEIALGEFTENTKNTLDFEELLIDITDNLANYLELEEKRINISNSNKRKMYDYLISPENSTPPAIKREIDKIKNSKLNEQWIINVVTFNYTNTIERILDNSIQNVQIGGAHNTILKSVSHIHGYTDNRMILGVNDESQITNNDFKTNKEFIEAFVKDEYNKLTKQLINESFQELISEADIICIFGSSLGATDNMWWQAIAEQLSKEVRVIIFHWSEKITPRKQFKIGVEERKIKSKLTNLTSDNSRDIDSKIFVSINSNMFRFN
jgi:hypothetical protein